MKKWMLLALLPLWSSAQLNVAQLGKLSYQNNTNDVWGYTDAQGVEYALVGTEAGVSIVDLSNPSQPQKMQFIQGPYSIWRDLKTWGHYAYVVHDSPYAWNTIPSQGLMVIDLDSVGSAPRFKTLNTPILNNLGAYDTLQRAHNLYIDENGICYLFGSNVGQGGALMYDVATDPWNPVYLGKYDGYYFHDGMARGDTLWGSAVYVGKFCAVDVSDPTNPVLMATHGTPNSFTHNTWISDDNKTLFCTDEQSAAYLSAYDVSDFNNITELDRIQTSFGNNVIPHNAHVYNQWVVTSYYTAGVQIVDAKYPSLMVEVGYYDTSPNFSGNGFYGNWGAYPYFSSGRLICTDIEEGLYVLDPEYVQASRLFVQVYDSITKAPMPLVEIKFGLAPAVETNIDGQCAQGTHHGGTDSLYINHAGFVPHTQTFTWNNGQFDTVRVALLNVNYVGSEEFEHLKIELHPNPSPNGQFQLTGVSDDSSFELYSLQGQRLEQGDIEGGQIQLGPHAPGQYYIHIMDGPVHKSFPVVLLP